MLICSTGPNLCHSLMLWRTGSVKHFDGLLTHWGRVTHICVSKLTSIASDNGLSPGRRQAIIWTSAGIMLIGPLRTNFSEILIEIITFSCKKMHFKVSSAKRRPFCLALNVLTTHNAKLLPRPKLVPFVNALSCNKTIAQGECETLRRLVKLE